MSLSVIESIKNINSVGRATAVVQKFSPQILTTVGVVGVVAAGVLAAKSTLKLESVIDEHSERMSDIHEKKTTMTAEEYSSTHHKRDVTKVYLHTAKNLGKLYGLPISLGVVSISCIIGGQGIQYKRTVGAIAAYKTLEETFDRYRARVVEEFGLEKDEEFHRGYKVTETVDENGAKDIKVEGEIDLSKGFTFIYDHNNPNWKTTSPDYNLMTLTANETYANQLLSIRGHVFLNDIFDAIGMPRTKEGSVVGWVLGPDNENHISFGIVDLQGSRNRDARIFGSDEELGDCLLMNFNVDGIVWNQI
jgi:hypothetical protein